MGGVDADAVLRDMVADELRVGVTFRRKPLKVAYRLPGETPAGVIGPIFSSRTFRPTIPAC